MKDGWSVGGFYQKRVFNESNQLFRYDAVHIPTSESVLITILNDEGNFYFQPSGFSITSKWILDDAKQCKILCFDELGKYECMHRGHYRTFQQLEYLFLDHTLLLLTLRKDPLTKIPLLPENILTHIWDLDQQPADISLFQEWMLKRIL